uniref:Peptidase M14 domain-containing protein n=1 Tax=Glossina pallidipes TaxID=7398 RepID=A0A1B0AEL8_GLOPL
MEVYEHESRQRVLNCRTIRNCSTNEPTYDGSGSLSAIHKQVPSQPFIRPLDWAFYPTLCEIYAWLDELIDKFPKIVTGFNIGRSYEGRLIRGIKISFKSGKKAIFIESNIHAREWITSSAITYVVKELLFSHNRDVRTMAESLDWYVIPVLNVDGFVYSHKKERLWRKSRRPASPDCRGTDLNRNFGFLWGQQQSDPCSTQYAGPHAESEPEIKQLKDFIDSIPDGVIKIYVGLHSAAQCVLTPWTHTKELPEHYDQMMFVAKAFAKALATRFGTRYKCGSSANVLKRFTGGSKDWAYAVKGIPISFTIELPGKGRLSRFELPEQMILPISMELLDGFIGMIEAVKELGFGGQTSRSNCRGECVQYKQSPQFHEHNQFLAKKFKEDFQNKSDKIGEHRVRTQEKSKQSSVPQCLALI